MFNNIKIIIGFISLLALNGCAGSLGTHQNTQQELDCLRTTGNSSCTKPVSDEILLDLEDAGYKPLYFYNMGLMHEKAKHHSAYNFIQAHMYFNLAASTGHAKARKARDEIAKEMTSYQIERAQDLALEFNERN